MGPLDLLLHLSSFVASALFLALLLPLTALVFKPKGAPAHSLWAQAAINFVAGTVVLTGGLWWFGRDGKMATYAALVLATATSQWLGGRAWR